MSIPPIAGTSSLQSFSSGGEDPYILYFDQMTAALQQNPPNVLQYNENYAQLQRLVQNAYPIEVVAPLEQSLNYINELVQNKDWKNVDAMVTNVFSTIRIAVGELQPNPN
jgi:hypothetical protein